MYTPCTIYTVGPFFISCGKESVFLTVDKHKGELKASGKISDASEFFVVRCDEGDNHFRIVYEAPPILEGDQKGDLEEVVGKLEHKPSVPMYLCASVNWCGKLRQNQQLLMQMNGKASKCRMALHSRRCKAVKLTEWINEKEVFYINCKEHKRHFKRNSYLCVNKLKDSSTLNMYTTRCEPDVNKHNDEDTFMLFRLLKPKDGKNSAHSF